MQASYIVHITFFIFSFQHKSTSPVHNYIIRERKLNYRLGRQKFNLGGQFVCDHAHGILDKYRTQLSLNTHVAG